MVAAAQAMVDLRPDIASYSRVAYLRELHGDENYARFCHHLMRGLAGKEVHYERESIDAHGRSAWISVSVRPHRDADGKVLANPPIPDKPEPYLAQLQNIARHYRQAPAVAAQPAQPVNVNNAYANLPMAPAAQQAQAQPPQTQAAAPQVAANPAAGFILQSSKQEHSCEYW